MRLETLESGKQGGVDVHDPALVALDERRCQNAHEARQHDEVGPVAVDFGGECRLERGAVRERAVVGDGGRDAALASDFEAARLRVVADDGRDPRWQPRIEHGLHVAAAPGDQDDEGLVSHAGNQRLVARGEY